MPRPFKCRWVKGVPPCDYYKPRGVPLRTLKDVTLSVDGFEALRLADANGMEHQQAAGKMGISRPTFSRILNQARQAVASAITQGWAIRIEGGQFAIAPKRPVGQTGPTLADPPALSKKENQDR